MAPACWAQVPLVPGEHPQGPAPPQRAASASHCRQSGRLGGRCTSKRSWSLLNWSVAEITSPLLKIKLLFRNIHIYPLSLRQLSLKIFGPTLFQWLLKSGNGAEKITSHACVYTHTHKHIHTLSKHCTWVTLNSNVLGLWEQLRNSSLY